MNQPPSSSIRFDWIAPVYDALAFLVFGQRLQRAQAVFLKQIPANSSVLLVGGGTGRLLAQLLAQCQPATILYLEPSARMVALATERMLPTAGSVEFRVGDEMSLRDGERFDVIITPFVLDLFTNETLKNHLIPRLLVTLKPDGLWLVTDFTGTSVWWQRALLWTMIRFFRLTTGIEARHLADWQQVLARSGLVRQQQQLRVGGMVSTEVWRRAD